ncbi:MAG: desulfoferrodoxin [Oscillospiraceae bacterium]|nr:desulfoferrodoxin [Oscillospiraceae bacterium]
MRFYICRHCGNLAGLIDNKGVPMICCGEAMAELAPNTVEASVEKHLPVVTAAGDSISVEIGSAAHPMLESHRIAFVYLETRRGGQRKSLLPGEAPALRFALADDTPVAVYAYCNLHGLWKTEIN